jgi:putative ABC transport system substrate-binding protein
VQILHAGTEQEINGAFAAAEQLKAQAIMVGADPFYTNQRDQQVALAARLRIPSIYPQHEWPEHGGLMSYGPNFVEVYRQVGVYTGQVLKGEKPANLPVQQSTKLEFVINLKTAKALGLAIPSGILAIADEVID